MKKILELIKSLLAKGFATKSEKAEVKSMLKELGDDEQETVKDDVAKVDDLPEEEGGDEEDKEIEKMLKSLISKTGEDNLKAVKAEVKEWLEEQKDLIAKKSGVYSPEVKANRARLNEWTRGFCKAVLFNDTEAVKELYKKGIFDGAAKKEMSTDGTGSPYGGYVTDSELSAEIRHLMTEYGVARREMMTMQLSKHSYKANELVTDLTTYWVDEAGSISSSQVVLGQNTLELKKIAAVVCFTSELLEDEEIDLAAFISSRVAEGFAQKEDNAFFNGDGSSPYGSFTGLLLSTYVNTVTMTGTTFASIDADDLLDMVDATPSGALKNGKYYMNRSIMSYVRKLKDDQNAPIFQRASEAGPATLWGYPVVDVEVMPTSGDTAADTPFVLFGDLKKGCILGYKGAIKAKRFDAGTIRNVAGNADINLITSDREAIRWTERVGYVQVIQNFKKPITVLKTAAASA